MRLVDGQAWNGQYASGRLEIYKDGLWGTVSWARMAQSFLMHESRSRQPPAPLVTSCDLCTAICLLQVCAEGFEDQDALVVCRQLGYVIPGQPAAGRASAGFPM